MAFSTTQITGISVPKPPTNNEYPFGTFLRSYRAFHFLEMA
ncbi:hypothetical protein LCGC14_2929880, partial [marine sediment metagenome]